MIRVSPLATLACLAISHASQFKGIFDVWSFDVGVGNYADWMDTIADNTPLTSLSIPGTHHSMTYDCENSLMQTQNEPLVRQLDGGIRYIDITCRYWKQDIIVSCGCSKAFYFFDIILRMLFDFLDAHPREAIILRIRTSGLFYDSKIFFDSFDKRFSPGSTIGDRAAKYIYGIHAGGITAVPSLGQIRGKVFILQDFKTPTPGRYGLPWNSDTVSSYNSKFFPSTLFIESEWAPIKSHLSEEPSPNSNKLRITHTTTSIGISRLNVAATNHPRVGMNRFLGRYLWQPDAKYFGIIAMDFPGDYLVRTILKLNDRYRVSKYGTFPFGSTGTPSYDIYFEKNEL
ncbi:1-phosphatidylinositol phosphodiesterase [Ceratocystis lukuohia]|uniref:1-phosphatidylinositol phosphodiesterase n=1 Tax=Ceratocystis lukuohia TaxID=2019550 RepID=A0ABR4MAC8_9PEZI